MGITVDNAEHAEPLGVSMRCGADGGGPGGQPRKVVVAAGANTAEHCVKVSNWKIGGGECERPLQVHFGAGAAEEEDPALDITPASLTSPAAERGVGGDVAVAAVMRILYIHSAGAVSECSKTRCGENCGCRPSPFPCWIPSHSYSHPAQDARLLTGARAELVLQSRRKAQNLASANVRVGVTWPECSYANFTYSLCLWVSAERSEERVTVRTADAVRPHFPYGGEALLGSQ